MNEPTPLMAKMCIILLIVNGQNLFHIVNLFADYVHCNVLKTILFIRKILKQKNTRSPDNPRFSSVGKNTRRRETGNQNSTQKTK